MGRLTPLEVLMAVTVPLAWAMGLVVTKGAISDFPPILLMAFRFLLTALILVAFTPLPKGNFFNLFLIAIVGAAIQYSLTFTGLLGLEAGIAAIIVQLEVPFLVMLGALLLGEKPGLRRWFGIGIAFCGIILMTWQGKFGASLPSVGLVIGGAMAWAFGQVMVRRLKDISGLQVTAWVAVFATPQLFLMSAIFESGQIGAITRAGFEVWGAVVYMAVIMTAFGYYLWNRLIRRHDVGEVAPYLLLLPLFSVVGGAVLLGERPGLEKLAGGLVILAGVALITLRFGSTEGAKEDKSHD